MRIFLRKLHRWLGLLMAIQIIAWMASGLYFSIFPIEEIRGAHLTRVPESLKAEGLSQMGSPAAVNRELDRHFGPGWELTSLSLVSKGDQMTWRIDGRVDGVAFRRLVLGDGTGVLPVLSAAEAVQIAQGWLLDTAEVQAIEWLESASPGSEIRGRNFPMWKVTFEEPESLNLYLDPWTGEILARRTTRWRVFDFFWMLHVMDFENRDDFNHPLLQIAAFLGLLIALSGVIFWAMTTSLFRKGQRVRSA
ncbi:MAG: PepSY domain-containing protein [Xanthomonadales bacterium]